MLFVQWVLTLVQCSTSTGKGIACYCPSPYVHGEKIHNNTNGCLQKSLTALTSYDLLPVLASLCDGSRRMLKLQGKGAAMTRKTSRQVLNDHVDQPCGDTIDGPQPVAASDVAGAQADRNLVERCLAGEVRAWEELYHQYHAPLCVAVKSLMGLGYCDPNLIDEIAARVWYALVRNDGQLLDRFDPSLDLRLGAFLRGLARVEIMQHFRSERRRRVRETQVGQKPLHDSSLSDWQIDAMLDEFASTLTPGEQRFMEEYLLSLPQEDSDPDQPTLSDANIWQRCHRIRTKLRTFFRNG
jgi:hypothetical protein